MSFVSIRVPKVRLAKLLRRPGGPPVTEALEQAASNLRAASPAYLADLTRILAGLEAAIADLPATYDAATLDEIYARASNPIGVASVCGLEAFDAALVSLCDLLDHLKTQELWDHEAIAVHVRALHLLLQSQFKSGSIGAEAILDGLRRVSRRYAGEAPAA